MKTRVALISALSLLACVGASCRGAEPPSAASLAEFQANADAYALQARERPERLGQLTDRYQLLAEQSSANPGYEDAAPREAAIAYRLYAGHMLVRVNGRPKFAKAKDALPWLTRATGLDSRFADLPEFKEAARYFNDVAGGESGDIAPAEWAQHMFRVCMVEATPQQIGEITGAVLGMANSIRKQEGLASALNADVEYLESRGKGEMTIKVGLMAFKATLHERNPGKDVGSDVPISITPLANGNTRVRYEFIDKTTPHLFEWEVNKTKGIVAPQTDGARMIMQLVGLEGRD